MYKIGKEVIWDRCELAEEYLEACEKIIEPGLIYFHVKLERDNENKNKWRVSEVRENADFGCIVEGQFFVYDGFQNTKEAIFVLIEENIETAIKKAFMLLHSLLIAAREDKIGENEFFMISEEFEQKFRHTRALFLLLKDRFRLLLNVKLQEAKTIDEMNKAIKEVLNSADYSLLNEEIKTVLKNLDELEVEEKLLKTLFEQELDINKK